ncbi:hypothetical protein EVAR_81038_1 [Eumeta japonica]|uniref:Uncharacterized protein n=1 Tax=Eumeta variegata TaxID=151549 RepID=A0A4C1T5H7_EUMVA|nr:hypothetical protein EVAR_81038_1 [Eumeta japonica]
MTSINCVHRSRKTVPDFVRNTGSQSRCIRLNNYWRWPRVVEFIDWPIRPPVAISAKMSQTQFSVPIADHKNNDSQTDRTRFLGVRYEKVVLAVDPTQFDGGSKNGPYHLVQCHAYQIQGRSVNEVPLSGLL